MRVSSSVVQPHITGRPARFLFMMPSTEDSAWIWAPWVAAGKTLQERRARLAQVPKMHVEHVQVHVRGVFELRAMRERKKR